MNDKMAVDAVIEQEIERWQEDQKQAAAHQYHQEFKSYCVWCRRART